MIWYPRASSPAFQFTPLREGRPTCIVPGNFIFGISIHAPPRGATSTSADTSDSAGFQFTPLREGRPGCITVVADNSNFNSRPSARGDMCREVRAPRPCHFNSRPSARGDASRRRRKPNPAYFNSRPSARGDTGGGKACLKRSEFQFTPLREGRRGRWEADCCGRYFNSRPSARGDQRPRPDGRL